MKFKKNLHLAKRITSQKINREIKNYPKQYPTPKYLLFIKQMIDSGWMVKLYKAGVSKYVFLIKGNDIFKIRFSNHLPLYYKEVESDCDYYVGVSHLQCSTTEQILNEIIKK
jgi:hypothetical protein